MSKYMETTQSQSNSHKMPHNSPRQDHRDYREELGNKSIYYRKQNPTPALEDLPHQPLEIQLELEDRITIIEVTLKQAKEA